MTEIARLVAAAQRQDATERERQAAFGRIVARFQDMAFGYAYALLGGDREAAEDAAQEAFLAAWRSLPMLAEPAAFPGWFRTIVLRRCQRRRRDSPPVTVPLEAAAHLAAADGDPQRHAERREAAAQVARCLHALPEAERTAALLFYIGDYSQKEIAEFLGVPVTTVKKRLFTARRRLQERMLTMVQDDLHAQRPSRDDAFAARIAAFTREFGQMLVEGVPVLHSLAALAERQEDPRFQSVILEIAQGLREGASGLSGTMARYPEFFDEHYTRAVCLGEDTGTADLQLERLAAGEEIFDDEGRIILRGADDPLIAGCASSVLWQAIHWGESRLRLTARPDGLRLFFRVNGQWQEGWRRYPEVLPALWAHFRTQAGIGGESLPQEGRFSYPTHGGTTYDVQVRVQAAEGGEEMILEAQPR
ncbi:MAG: sigma-70 family RNA polymerase sigma factor [Armatimonadetes bacterium]|nr:sigma-70 family RNA polymerase sigma factor [Armatimonadota bacterium]